MMNVAQLMWEEATQFLSLCDCPIINTNAVTLGAVFHSLHTSLGAYRIRTARELGPSYDLAAQDQQKGHGKSGVIKNVISARLTQGSSSRFLLGVRKCLLYVGVESSVPI